LLAVAFGQVVRIVEPEMPAGWLAVVGREVDGLDGAAEQDHQQPPSVADAFQRARDQAEVVIGANVPRHGLRNTS
jgi:hypothetical protein